MITPKEATQAKAIAENILKKVDDFHISLQAETLARAYLDLEKELSEAPIYDIYVLESEIAKLKEELERLRKD